MTDPDAAWAELHAATSPGWYVGTPRYHVGKLILKGLLAAVVVAACAGPVPGTATPSVGARPERTETVQVGVDPQGAQLLRRFGLEPTGPTESSRVVIGPPDEQPWDLLLEASRKVGLDFRSLVGRNVEMRKTPVGQAPVEGSVVTAYVLIADGAPAGAWLGVSNSVPGILALSERP